MTVWYADPVLWRVMFLVLPRWVGTFLPEWREMLMSWYWISSDQDLHLNQWVCLALSKCEDRYMQGCCCSCHLQYTLQTNEYTITRDCCTTRLINKCPSHTALSGRESCTATPPLCGCYRAERGDSSVAALICLRRKYQSHSWEEMASVWMDKLAAWNRGVSVWWCSQSDN